MAFLFCFVFFLLLNVSSKTSLHPQHIHDVLNIIFLYNVLQYRVKKLLLKVVLTLCIPRGVVFICHKNEYIIQECLSSLLFTTKPYKTIYIWEVH